MVSEIWKVTDKTFCHFGHFLPLYPTNNLTNQCFEKMQRTPGNIIMLHMCTINDNHMMYGSSDMERNGHTFLSFCTVFCPFIPEQLRKSKFWKNERNTWRYYHFTNVYHKWQSYKMVPERWSSTNNLFSFLVVFFSFTPLTTAKSKSWKNEKNPGDIIILHKGTKNHDLMLNNSSDTIRGGCNF